MDDFKPCLVEGCGVSILCHDRESVLKWCEYVLARGGWPIVKPYVKAALVLVFLQLSCYGQGIFHPCFWQTVEVKSEFDGLI